MSKKEGGSIVNLINNSYELYFQPVPTVATYFQLRLNCFYLGTDARVCFECLMVLLENAFKHALHVTYSEGIFLIIDVHFQYITFMFVHHNQLQYWGFDVTSAVQKSGNQYARSSKIIVHIILSPPLIVHWGLRFWSVGRHTQSSSTQQHHFNFICDLE